MTTQLPIPKERLEQILAHCKREAPENMAPISAGSAVEIIGALLAAHEQEPPAENIRIADALESLLWPNMALGNKAVIQAAIDALRTKSAPVPAVPDIDTWRTAFEYSERQRDEGFNLHKFGTGYADDATQKRWESWLSSRAAMLNGGKS
ncbi:TPA: hypothetical protein I8287_002117 [Kluyvera intermedia]|nr:hypothetical protein [Kluyvera intermedia]